MNAILKKALLAFLPKAYWSLFSVKRLFRSRKRFGFLSDEFFAEHFLKDKLCDIGGFGMTAKVITEYYGDKLDKSFCSAALFNRTLDKQTDWRLHVGESLVYTVPNAKQSYSRNFLTYSYHASSMFDFLLSIDLYPTYEYSLHAMPKVPLIIWLRDPKGEVELKRIATIRTEIEANRMSNAEEFAVFARSERDFFSRIHEQSAISERPIIFVTNAHCLTPRAQRLYALQELNPHFLPNPIHYPTLGKFEKSKKPTVCLLGRLDPVKRPWICFELAKRFKHVDFLICGSSSYPETMNPIIEKYRHVDNLKFMGLVQGEQKEQILSQSWVLINTSIHEGLPCSFLEALSCHTPIVSSVNPDDIVSRFGIHAGDNLGDGLDADTLDQFQASLEKMLSDGKKLEEQGAEARKYIEKIYSFDAFEKNLHQILATEFQQNFRR